PLQGTAASYSWNEKPTIGSLPHRVTSVFDQRPQRVQVLDVFVEIVRFRRLEAAGMFPKPWIVDDVTKAFLADFPAANVLVAIDARSKIRFRIVQMKGKHFLQSD